MTQGQQDDVMRSLGRIEAKVDALGGLHERVSTLEKWQAYLKGGWAVLMAVVGWVGWHK